MGTRVCMRVYVCVCLRVHTGPCPMSSPEESGAPDIHQERTNVWVRPCAGWPAHQAGGLLRGPLLLPRNPEIQEDPKAKFSLHSRVCTTQLGLSQGLFMVFIFLTYCDSVYISLQKY